jgi:hypothetical protein
LNAVEVVCVKKIRLFEPTVFLLEARNAITKSAEALKSKEHDEEPDEEQGKNICAKRTFQH